MKWIEVYWFFLDDENTTSLNFYCPLGMIIMHYLIVLQMTSFLLWRGKSYTQWNEIPSEVAFNSLYISSTYQVHIIDFRKILNPLCYVLVDKLGKPYNEIQSHLSHHVETTALCPKSWVLGIGIKFCFSLFSFFWPFLAFCASAISRIISSFFACLSFSWKVKIVNS